MMRKAFLIFTTICCSISLFAQSDTTTEAPKVFTIVEQMPEFPGGDEALFKFIQENVQYPTQERDNNIQGRVIVGFLVYEDGSIHDVIVKRGVSEGLNNEAVRVIKKLPNFKPGKQQGKPVRVSYVLPLVFKLSEEDLVVSKITPQKPLTSAISGSAIANWEKSFSLCFKNNVIANNKQSKAIVIDFSLTQKGDVANFKIRSGGNGYDEKRIKKCLSSTLNDIRSLFPEDLLGAKYWISITVL